MKASLQFTAILLLFACNPKSTERIQSEEILVIEKEEIKANIEDTISNVVVNEIVTEEPDGETFFPKILEFEKTACYGKCPSFKVQIFSNGKAVYHGLANVENIGLFESSVNDSFLFLVFQEAEKIGYFKLNNKYPIDGKDIPDLPKTITYLQDGNNELQVVDAFDSPLALQRFEQFLINKVESLYWTKIADNN